MEHLPQIGWDSTSVSASTPRTPYVHPPDLRIERLEQSYARQADAAAPASPSRRKLLLPGHDGTVAHCCDRTDASVSTTEPLTPARDESQSCRRTLTSRLLCPGDASVRRPRDQALGPRPGRAPDAELGDARLAQESRSIPMVREMPRGWKGTGRVTCSWPAQALGDDHQAHEALDRGSTTGPHRARPHPTPLCQQRRIAK
jgi:hypothetical protein